MLTLTMTTRWSLLTTLLLALMLVSCTTNPATRQAKHTAPPNVILIMVDDMGFSDLGCYGGEIRTPNIDSLAAGGVRFAQFYNSARCCPTRATLMTGLAPHQVGIGHMTVGPKGRKHSNVPPAYQGNLNARCVTLAHVAQGAGYATHMTGKWHLSGMNEDDWPLQRGFEKYYGCLAGAVRYFHPTGARIMYDGNTPDPDPTSTTDHPFYTTDAFTDRGLQFIAEEQAGDNRPFFWYLAYNAPHWPLQAPEEDIARYRGKYKIGWDQLRQQRYQRQIELGLIDPQWPLSPRDADVPAWDTLNDEQQTELDLRMAIYAAMIDRVDQNIGKLVAFLKKQELYDNTLILFLSDNGACAEGGVLGRGNILDSEARNASHDAAVGKAWANVSSTPFRLYKHFAHEGGAATPFFLHWPDRIQPRAEWYRDPAQLIDVMPTLVEVVGGSYPAEFKGNPIPPGEGVSLAPTFDGQPLHRPSPLFIEHENNAFVRDGQWKLVGRGVAPNNGLQPEKWELYDLEQDRTELNNQAGALPDRVEAMSAQWTEWADRVGVFPKTQEGR